jgi:predicted site-specific integrase-resolvase
MLNSQIQSAANAYDCEKEQPMSNLTKQKYTILYAHLNLNDEWSEPGGSIQNQRDFLEKYAEQNGLKPYRHLQDDGYSGTLWTRLGWQELIAEIEAERVNAVVVKNLDRVGRDYLRVGLFMEQLRGSGVRLICVSDSIDTANGIEDDFTPFRAILAEWYSPAKVYVIPFIEFPLSSAIVAALATDSPLQTDSYHKNEKI